MKHIIIDLNDINEPTKETDWIVVDSLFGNSTLDCVVISNLEQQQDLEQFKKIVTCDHEIINISDMPNYDEF